ncbi:glycosyltransferase family 4 protein [Dietzia sp.]|uniref:glycosyltransferase family 4 protein n=1 Tax=Dietzia sp. TaxID=1871616 RepID=UPI002FD9277A
MRIAIVAESFLPNVNGVTNSVLRVLEYARAHGHECLVVAPRAEVGFLGGAVNAVKSNPYVQALTPLITPESVHYAERDHYLGFPIHRVTAVRVPMVTSLPIAAPSPSVYSALRTFDPDVVHLASPFILGAAGAAAAKMLGVPSVAIYQTDVAGFSESYGMSIFSETAWMWTRAIHTSCQRTLAPSTAAMEDLRRHDIPRLHKWGRGVDAVGFHPAKRSEELHAQWSPEGRPVVGFVGRLAPEKHVERLRAIAERSGPGGDLQLVIVGDGPERAGLERLMPNAVFTGALGGADLHRAYATMDVFCHAGEFETFCQAIQEAHASGVPVVGPRAGGPRDLVQDEINGFLLEPAEYAEKVSGAIDTILEDLPRYRLASRDTVADRTWESLCEQLMEHYVAAGARDRRSARSRPRDAFRSGVRRASSLASL